MARFEDGPSEGVLVKIMDKARKPLARRTQSTPWAGRPPCVAYSEITPSDLDSKPRWDLNPSGERISPEGDTMLFHFLAEGVSTEAQLLRRASLNIVIAFEDLRQQRPLNLRDNTPVEVRNCAPALFVQLLHKA